MTSTLITPTQDLVTITRLRKNLLAILHGVGRIDTCRRRPDGSSGCGCEIFWVSLRGGRPVQMDDEGNRHSCEVKR